MGGNAWNADQTPLQTSTHVFGGEILGNSVVIFCSTKTEKDSEHVQ